MLLFDIRGKQCFSSCWSTPRTHKKEATTSKLKLWHEGGIAYSTNKRNAKQCDDCKQRRLPVSLDKVEKVKDYLQPELKHLTAYQVVPYDTDEKVQRTKSASDFVVTQIPHSMLIDATGRILWRGEHSVDADDNDIEPRINDALDHLPLNR